MSELRQDVVCRRKRVVRLQSGEVSLGDFYLNDWVTTDSYAADSVVSMAWERLRSFFLSNPTSFASLVYSIGLYNMYVKEVWNVVNVSIGYRHDDPVFQTPDFWLLPNETWALRYGDCEDTTFLLLSSTLNLKRSWADTVSRESVEYGVIGFYRDYSGTYYGHAFIIRSSSRIAGGRWLWVETTLDYAVPQQIWYAWNPNILVPVYWFDGSKTYRVDKDYSVLGLTSDYVKTHESYIRAMIEYVETGRWTSVKWLHKKRRPARVDEGVEVVYVSTG
ncbi:MAG: hypothetical protein QXK11_07380 [Pyrobaculum sp.]|uniref:hypothetical protein n=1 Tax=Pyrobaculum sp. TaxID=2004705 RepID=UPI00316EFB3B